MQRNFYLIKVNANLLHHHSLRSVYSVGYTPVKNEEDVEIIGPFNITWNNQSTKQGTNLKMTEE